MLSATETLATAVGVSVLAVGMLVTSVSAAQGVEKLEVTHLPGLTQTLNFKQWSGYLKSSPTHYLHYWFLESQKDPASSPVVVWYNGGPGCSSMGGLLEELGPFLIRDDASSFTLNPYSWNREANLLVIEAPAGVGFSYSTDFNVTTGDNQTAAENYASLHHFFRLFPQYRHNDLFITGESYAGVYIPTLVTKILQEADTKSQLNLKGMAIGNGAVHKNLNTDTLMEFAYQHGLIDENLWQTLVATCCGGCSSTCHWHNTSNAYCRHQVDANNLQVWLGGLNTYDLIRYCKNPGSLSGWQGNGRFIADLLGLADATSINRAGKEVIDIDPDKLDTATIDKLIDLASPCLNETAMTLYLQRADVRAAIGIPDFVPEFEHCSSKVGPKYRKEDFDMSPHVLNALKRGVRVLLYYGDTDMACNHLLGQRFAAQLGVPKLREKQPWYYKDQIEGFVTRYQGLDYLTVKGIGHMVPQWKPAPSFHMIDRFLKNEAY